MVASSSIRYLLVVLILIGARAARAEILFEGFAKVLLDSVHVGYVIQRYEFDPKKKEFTTAYYLKTGPRGGSITESLKATSSTELRKIKGKKEPVTSLWPVSYEYTSVQGDETTRIDAIIKNNELVADVIEGKKRGTVRKTLPDDAILSSFLGYALLSGPEGLKPGVNYSYKGVTEEDIEVVNGTAKVDSEETVLGVKTFAVFNKFKKTRDKEESKFVSWITYKGEVIKTASPRQKISTELVATLAEASAGLPLNTDLISKVFGSVPKGKENVIARRASGTTEVADASAPAESPEAKQKRLEKKSSVTGSSPKKEGVPGGKGIMIKGAPTPTGDESK